LKKAEGRAPEQVKAKNLEQKAENKEKVETKVSTLKDVNLYNTGVAKGEHVELLGF
jgi:hypothetical protein